MCSWARKKGPTQKRARGLANRGLPFWPHQVLYAQHRKPPDLEFSQALTFRYAFGRTTACHLFNLNIYLFRPLLVCSWVKICVNTVRGTRNRKDFFHHAATILSYLLFCFSGNSYNIKNLRQTEAKLTFVQIKG